MEWGIVEGHLHPALAERLGAEGRGMEEVKKVEVLRSCQAQAANEATGALSIEPEDETPRNNDKP
jgi:hypothetical protein